MIKNKNYTLSYPKGRERYPNGKFPTENIGHSQAALLAKNAPITSLLQNLINTILKKKIDDPMFFNCLSNGFPVTFGINLFFIILKKN